eukprot:COSAG05_NODE_2480_length_3009_cov_3.316495_4_plen_107_part_01
MKLPSLLFASAKKTTDKAVCFATLAAEYISLTEAMPIEDDAFILTEAPRADHGNKLWGLGADRLAKRMRAMMTLAGIPTDFLAHSARHAGINLRKDGAQTLIDLGYQ